MSVDALASQLLTSARFAEHYGAAAVSQVATDLLRTPPDDRDIDWSYLLSCASVMATSQQAAALDAALRIAQTALTAADADEEHRDAAVLLLDRAGNSPALALARADAVGSGRKTWAITPHLCVWRSCAAG